MEIEKMEGLYVRSRQENDKAFRKWLKAKNRQAREDEIRHWEQVQVNQIQRTCCAKFCLDVKS